MSNKPFDRNISNTREKLISGDFNLMQAYSDLAVREYLLRVYSPRTSIVSDVLDRSYSARFASDGFKVRPTSPTGLSVTVGAGLAFIGSPTDSQTSIDSITGLNDTNALKPVVLTEDQEFIVPANNGLLPRIDIIEVAYNKEVTDTETREVLNQTSGNFANTAVDKTFSWSLDGLTGTVVSPSLSLQPLSYKIGPTSGAMPDITSGYTKIAEVYVPPSASTIEDANIADFRKLFCPAGQMLVSAVISLPKVNFGVTTEASLKPTVLSLSAPAGVSVSCYADTDKKTYDFIITGNFSSASATVRAIGSFDEAASTNPTTKQFTSDAVDARIRGVAVEEIGSARATSAADASLADPVLNAPATQLAAIVNFSPYQIFQSGPDIKYKTIVSSVDADPMTVCLIAFLQY